MTALPPSKRSGDRPVLTPLRLLVWIVVGGIGLTLLTLGVLGIIAKAG